MRRIGDRKRTKISHNITIRRCVVVLNGETFTRISQRVVENGSSEKLYRSSDWYYYYNYTV